MNTFKQPGYFHERKFKAPQTRPLYLCFQRNAKLQFEECHMPGKNTFLNPHFYSVLQSELDFNC